METSHNGGLSDNLRSTLQTNDIRILEALDPLQNDSGAKYKGWKQWFYQQHTYHCNTFDQKLWNWKRDCPERPMFSNFHRFRCWSLSKPLLEDTGRPNLDASGRKQNIHNLYQIVQVTTLGFVWTWGIPNSNESPSMFSSGLSMRFISFYFFSLWHTVFWDRPNYIIATVFRYIIFQ